MEISFIMNKILLLSLAALCYFVAVADDIIFTTSKQQIICTLTDITDSQVSYTRSDTPAITRHIATENIWKIIYGNGVVEEINNVEVAQPVQEPTVIVENNAGIATPNHEEKTLSTTEGEEAAVSAESENYVTTPETEIAVPEPKENKTVYRDYLTGPLTMSKGRMYLDGKCLSDVELENLVKECHASRGAYERYKKARTVGPLMTFLGFLFCTPVMIVGIVKWAHAPELGESLGYVYNRNCDNQNK